MDFDTPKHREIFFEIHADLPRQAPGSRESTARALDMARPLPNAPHSLDLGCGPGMQTLHLAELLPGATITAVDTHTPFLEDLNRRAATQGVSDRITTHRTDMATPPVPKDSIDLIWCEGAAYILGIETALTTWKPFLKPGGKLALTEAVWLRPDPPDAVRQFWTAYPGMGSIADVRKTIHQCGYTLLGDFVLPENDWWEPYYTPLEQRLTMIRQRHTGDSVAEAVISEVQLEIDLYRAHSDTYGYAFFVMSA